MNENYKKIRYLSKQLKAMTAIQEPSLVSLRHGGVFSRLWNIVSRRQAGRTRGGKVLLAIFLFVVLFGSLTAVAAASPVRREGPPPPQATAPKICPGEDIHSKVNLADKVFEGKVRSRSPTNNGLYNVTFGIKHVYKGLISDFLDRQVRLQFAEKSEGRKSQQIIECSINNNDKVGSVVKANLKRGRSGKNGKRYIVFVDEVGPRMYVPHGEPVIRNKENRGAVKDALCRAPPRLTGMRDKTVSSKVKLTLTCRDRRSEHQPNLHWYKDGVKLDSETPKKGRIRFHKKKLVITKVRPDDAGVYECRTVSPTCDPVILKAKITVIGSSPNKESEPDKEKTSTSMPFFGIKCPIDSYCLNGGTCFYYDTIGEMACQCAEGYKGQRCDLKDVYNTAKRRRKCSSSNGSSSGGKAEHRVRHPGGLCAPTVAPLRARAGSRAWRAQRDWLP